MTAADQYQQELAENFQRELHIAKKIFQKEKTPKSIFNGVRECYRRLDRQISSNIVKHSIKTECKAGCSHCCSTRVEVFGYEIVAISKYINDTTSGEQKIDLMRRLEEASNKARGLRIKEHFLPCALLIDGMCSIYAMRPAMCRKFNSVSLVACISSSHAFLGMENEGLRETTMASIQGFAEGCRQAGLKKEVYELNQALYVALLDSTALKKWMAGSEVFVSIPEAGKIK